MKAGAKCCLRFLSSQDLFLGLVLLLCLAGVWVALRTTGFVPMPQTGGTRVWEQYELVMSAGHLPAHLVGLAIALLVVASTQRISLETVAGRIQRVGRHWLTLAVIAAVLPWVPFLGADGERVHRFVSLPWAGAFAVDLAVVTFVIFYLACCLAPARPEGKSRRGEMLLGGLLIFILYKQPHFEAILFLFVLVLALLVLKENFSRALQLAGAAGVTLVAYAFLTPAGYRFLPKVFWMHDPYWMGYQAWRSTLAWERGGVSGIGMQEPIQMALLIPNHARDYMFSAVGELWGVIGGLGVALLFCFYFAFAMRAVSLCKNPVLALISYGLAMLVMFSALASMLQSIGWFPPGAPMLGLPFFGGGTASLLILAILSGLVYRLLGEVPAHEPVIIVNEQRVAGVATANAGIFQMMAIVISLTLVAMAGMIRFAF